MFTPFSAFTNSRHIALIACTFSSVAFAENTTQTQLNSVVVTANNAEQTEYSVTAPMTIITRADIENNQYRTLDQVLETLPGMVVKRNGGLGQTSTVLMRGQNHNATLILVDGVEMTNPMGTGGAILANMTLSNVERIEIIQGPQSGIWGANASAGVINVITRQPESLAEVDVSAGSHGTRQLSTTLGASEKQADFLFQLSQLNTDGFSSVRPYRRSNDGLENDAFQQTDVSFKLGLKPSKGHRIEAMIKESNGISEYDSTTDPNASGSFYQTSYQNKVKRLGYKYDTKQFNGEVYGLENEINQYNDATLTEVGLRGRYEYDKAQFLAASATKKSFNGVTSSSIHYRYDSASAGINHTHTLLNNKWVLNEALRYDEYSAFDNKTTGKIGAKFYVKPELFLSANYGTAYNAPTLYQVTYNATENLQPEETEAYDISLGLYGFELTYYNTQTKNLIDYGGTWPNDYYENLTGTSTFEGVEANYHQPLKTIHSEITLGYAYLEAKNSKGEALRNRPDHKAFLRFDNRSIARLHWSINTRYVGSVYDKDNRQGAQIGHYFVTDVNSDYEWSPQLTLYAQVLNLFNDDYTTAVASYASGDTPGYVYGNGGTQITLGLRGTFN